MKDKYEIIFSDETPEGVYAAKYGQVWRGTEISDELNRLAAENQALTVASKLLSDKLDAIRLDIDGVIRIDCGDE